MAAAVLLALIATQATADGFNQAALPLSGTQSAPSLIQEWRALLGGGAGLTESTKVQRVNDFFNQRIRHEDDADVWGQSDYWATPMETLAQGRGDCEDFAIAKYFTLLEIGVPASRLRLVYAKASLERMTGHISRAHMVLAYYPHPESTPLLLDNLTSETVPASARSDLIPVFSFNTEGLWIGTGNQASHSSYSRWQELVVRTRREGFLQNNGRLIQRAGL